MRAGFTRALAKRSLMLMIRLRIMSLVAGLVCAPSGSALAQHFQPDELNRLWAAAGLEPVSSGGDLMRYTVRRIPGYVGRPSATVVQAAWFYAPRTDARVTITDLQLGDTGWIVSRQQSSYLRPFDFERLIGSVLTAAAVSGDLPQSRGRVMRCSHDDTSQLDISLTDRGFLQLSRQAHCSDDAPAVVAGRLLIAAAERDPAAE